MVCSRCQEEKDEKSFRQRKGKRRSICRQCESIAVKQYLQEIREGKRTKKTVHPKDKVCVRCKQKKPVSEFYYLKTIDQYGSTCKSCEREKRKEAGPQTEFGRLKAEGKKRCKVCGSIKFFVDFRPNRAICIECWKASHPPKPKKEKKSKLKGDSSKHNQRVKYQRELLAEGKKECNKCRKVKSVSDFRIHRRGTGEKPSDYFPWCKECHDKYTSHYEEEKGICRKRRSVKEILDHINSEFICEHCKEAKGIWHFPVTKEYMNVCCSCRKKLKNIRKHLKNKERPMTENQRLQRRISEKIKGSLRGRKKGSGRKYLGCDISFLKEWLSSQFTDGMSWDNYGEWHIDHYIPQAFFKDKDEKEWRICWNYRNLRPLWAKDNIDKADTLPDDWEEKYAEIKKAVFG